MFVREKTVNGYTYLYLVETVREDGRTKQRIIRNLGRKEAVLASGALDRLVASIGRFAERSLVLRAIDEGDTRLEVRRIGAPLLFGRLWEETGCRAVVSQLLTLLEQWPQKVFILNPAVERSVLPFLGAIVSPSARPEAVGARVDGPVVGLRGTSSALPPGSGASDPLRSTAPHF